MQTASTPERDGPRWPILAIKLLMLAALAVIAWPIPAMVSHASPDPAVLGRYTLKYFVLMAAYLAGAAVWGGLTLWAVWRLTPARLVRVRAWLVRCATGVLGGFVLLSFAVLGIARAVQFARITFPITFQVAMPVVIPSLYLAVCALLALALDRPTAQQIVCRSEEQLAGLGRSSRLANLAAALRPHRAPVGLAILAAGLAALAVQRGIWRYPFLGDESAHLYMGQRLLEGGLPYRSFIHFQPPGRLIITLAWAWVARVTGLPIVHVARAYNVGAGIALLAITYGMGRRLTGRALGGLLAAAILLGLEPLLDVIVSGPNLKLTLALVAMLSILMAQCGRWFWAGVLVGCAVTFWLPAGAFALAVMLAAGLQSDRPRWRAALHVALGAALVFALVIAVLALAGILDDAYRQTIVGTWLYVRGISLARPGGGSGGGVRFPALSNSARLLRWHLEGELVFALLALGAALASLWPRGLRTPARSAPFFAFVLVAVALAVDAQGKPDLLVILPLFALFAASALTGLLGPAERRLAPHAPNVLRALQGVILALVLVYGLSDPNQHFDEAMAVSLADQQRMADRLDGALAPGQTVQSFGDLWFAVLSWRPNATRYGWLGPKVLVALEAEGVTVEDVVSEMEAQTPVVVMATPRSQVDPVAGWLGENYHHVTTLMGQDILVREGHEDLAALIAAWSPAGEQP